MNYAHYLDVSKHHKSIKITDCDAYGHT